MAVKTTLKIDTKLGRQAETGDEGPLLLAMVQGIEGVSMPYAYDVTMYRHIKDGDLNPREMINTKVAIHMRGKTDNYTSRRGVFQTFEKDGTNKRTFEKGTHRLPGLQGKDCSFVQDVGLRIEVPRI